ncbi:glycosyltransferase [Bacillus sp. VT-16-64]|uniref:WecB/TagA/CpsF family glycosyltransferase n=1 Tax=Siminovitchia sp. FSL W7-1587 TaxID=2954699 RepID=UPI00097D1109|nr:glycosyltransferase [Bacillus sp. VT-16-64]
MSKKVDVLGIEFDNMTQKQMIDMIKTRIKQKKKTFIVTANPEIVMKAQRDQDYKDTLQSADFIIPDGVGIMLGAKMLKRPLLERVAGFDLMTELLAVANQDCLNVFFLGSKDNVIQMMIRNVKQEYPNVQIGGYHHGYFEGNDPRITDMVKKANSDLVFVAMGFPRQERWIQKNVNVFEKGIFIGVGGSFDVLAGVVKRAPTIWRSWKIEWLYRLCKQPSRWKRMTCLPLFVLKILGSTASDTFKKTIKLIR